MFRSGSVWLTALLLPTALICSPLRADPKPWIDLFNGKDLTGWVQKGGQAKYSVEDGCIVGRSVPNTSNSFLCTEKRYSDFVLECEFKVDPDLNSGVQIRSNSLPEYKNGRVHGYQVEIDCSEKRNRWWTAGIYDEGRRGWLYPGLCGGSKAEFTRQGARLTRRGDWNHVRVEAVGVHIRTWLNGELRADMRDGMTSSGFIALQVHGVGKREEPLYVRWRNLRLQDLSGQQQ